MGDNGGKRMRKRPKPKKLTDKWLKRHGFTNALWRLEERARLAKEAARKRHKR